MPPFDESYWTFHLVCHLDDYLRFVVVTMLNLVVVDVVHVFVVVMTVPLVVMIVVYLVMTVYSVVLVRIHHSMMMLCVYTMRTLTCSPPPSLQ